MQKACLTKKESPKGKHYNSYLMWWIPTFGYLLFRK